MRRALIAAALVWHALASLASAQPVTVRVAPCSELGFDTGRLLPRVLSVELRADGVTAVRASRRVSVADVSLRAPCEGGSSIDVLVRDRRDGQTFLRRVELSGVPRSLRLRVIAMSTAELLRASWARQLEAPPARRRETPAPAPRWSSALASPEAPPSIQLDGPHSAGSRVSASLAAPDDEPPDRPATSEPRPSGSGTRGALDAAGASRAFPDSGLLLAGAQLGATVSFEDALVLTARGGALGTELSSTFGGTDLVIVPLSIGVAGRAPLGPVRLDLGARLEGGPAVAKERLRFSRNEVDGWVTHGYFLAAGAVELALPITEGLEAFAHADLGWTFAGFDLRLSADRTSSLRGWTVGSGVGLRLSP